MKPHRALAAASLVLAACASSVADTAKAPPAARAPSPEPALLAADDPPPAPPAPTPAPAAKEESKPAAQEPPKPAPEPTPGVEGEKEASRIALLLAIDVSGSMSSNDQIEMEKRSAIAAARALSATDRVGVITFDEEARIVAPFQDAADLETLEKKLAAIQPGRRGTNFHAPLKLGYQTILAERCGIRLVILITDGMDTMPAVISPLIREGTAKGVTLSAIALGDADAQLTRMVAWGKGKLYCATDPSHLPQITTVAVQRCTTQRRDDARQKVRPAVDDPALPGSPKEEPKPAAQEEPPKPAPAPAPTPPAQDDKPAPKPPIDEPVKPAPPAPKADEPSAAEVASNAKARAILAKAAELQNAGVLAEPDKLASFHVVFHKATFERTTTTANGTSTQLVETDEGGLVFDWMKGSIKTQVTVDGRTTTKAWYEPMRIGWIHDGETVASLSGAKYKSDYDQLQFHRKVVTQLLDVAILGKLVRDGSRWRVVADPAAPEKTVVIERVVPPGSKDVVPLKLWIANPSEGVYGDVVAASMAPTAEGAATVLYDFKYHAEFPKVRVKTDDAEPADAALRFPFIVTVHEQREGSAEKVKVLEVYTRSVDVNTVVDTDFAQPKPKK